MTYAITPKLVKEQTKRNDSLIPIKQSERRRTKLWNISKRVNDKPIWWGCKEKVGSCCAKSVTSSWYSRVHIKPHQGAQSTSCEQRIRKAYNSVHFEAVFYVLTICLLCTIPNCGTKLLKGYHLESNLHWISFIFIESFWSLFESGIPGMRSASSTFWLPVNVSCNR